MNKILTLPCNKYIKLKQREKKNKIVEVRITRSKVSWKKPNKELILYTYIHIYS